MTNYIKLIPFYSVMALATAVSIQAYSNELGQNPLESLSYGEIYLAQPERLVEGHNDFSVCYGIGLGVPEYKLHSINLSVEHWLAQTWWLGANFEYNKEVKSPLQKNMETLLARTGNGVTYEYPTMAFRGSAGIVPFSGLVNIFGKKVLPYELSILTDIGLVEYTSATGPGPYILASEKVWHGISLGIGLDQRIQLYKNNGIKFGLNQFFENSFDKKSSNQRSVFTIGWYGRY
jgi:hypothetical protein